MGLTDPVNRAAALCLSTTRRGLIQCLPMKPFFPLLCLLAGLGSGWTLRPKLDKQIAVIAPAGVTAYPAPGEGVLFYMAKDGKLHRTLGKLPDDAMGR
jgi:hypothetical protein